MKEDYQFKGCWIKGPDRDYYQDQRNTVVLKQFSIRDRKQTYLYIATLGYSIIYINGQRITEDELNLVWTQFQKCVY